MIGCFPLFFPALYVKAARFSNLGYFPPQLSNTVFNCSRHMVVQNYHAGMTTQIGREELFERDRHP